MVSGLDQNMPVLVWELNVGAAFESINNEILDKILENWFSIICIYKKWLVFYLTAR